MVSPNRHKSFVNEGIEVSYQVYILGPGDIHILHQLVLMKGPGSDGVYEHQSSYHYHHHHYNLLGLD